MTPQQFFTAAAPFAKWAHVDTGVLESVVLAQWADENGYVWPPPGNNPGNVGNTQHGGMVNYANITQGVAAYIQTMLLGYYKAVRAAQTWQGQAVALGESPWAAGHYGSPPGSALVDIIEQYGLTSFDNGGTTPPPTPGPAPAPSVKPEMLIALTQSGKGYWLCSPSGAVEAFGDAQYFGGPNTSKSGSLPYGGPPNLPAGQTCTSMVSWPGGQGYSIVSDAGLVFSYGAALWLGNFK